MKMPNEDNSNKYVKVLNNLFLKAFHSSQFETICTVLRVGGLNDSNWDPFEESREAFEDFKWLMETSGEQRSIKCQIRVALLTYCQLIEMSAPQEMIMNLLNCQAGYYLASPFSKGKVNKNNIFYFIPPSAKQKFKQICDLAQKCEETDLILAINTFFSDVIRNAFSHSDYIITQENFRYSEGRLPSEISLELLNKILNECFEFYIAFMQLHKHWLIQLSKINKYHKWPNYEVLELLSNENGLYGFNVHFSNGTKATYTRGPNGTNATNIIVNNNGISLFQGPLDELEKRWKINGAPVDDWAALN